jgi:hypothetical protein
VAAGREISKEEERGKCLALSSSSMLRGADFISCVVNFRLETVIMTSWMAE